MRKARMVVGISILVFSVVHLWVGSVSGSERYWTPERREACPEGHRTAIVLGDTTLYIDFRMITDLQLGNNPVPGEKCPATAFKASSVTFYYGYRQLARLYKEWQLPLSSLKIELRDDLSDWGLPAPTMSDRRVAIGKRGFIEDVTDRVVVDRRPAVMGRAYLLQHDDSPDFGEPILVRCLGTPSTGANRRDCETRYFVKPALAIRYVVRQDARDQSAKTWDILPAGPIQEPEGLLDVDRRVRELVRYLATTR